MVGKLSRKRLGLIATYALLSVVTILLLAVSFRFFTSSYVRVQIADWVRGMSGNPHSGEFAWLAGAPTPFQPTDPTPQPSPTREQRAALPTENPESRATRTPAPTATLTPTPTEDPYALPQGTLVIPELNLEEPLVLIPVRGGKWDLSDLGDGVGWLQTTGNRPQADLAMVLIGHVTLPYPGGAGPFLDLYTLGPGDEVYYHTADGTYVYEVRYQSLVSPQSVENLYIPDGNKLILVTCTGWNAIEEKYDLRLLVELELKQSGTHP